MFELLPAPATGEADRTARLLAAIRTTGARQPVIVSPWPEETFDDPNLTYRASVGVDPARGPLLVAWDLALDDPTACAALPTDPSEVSALVQSNLDDFDSRQISWTVSAFLPGKMIMDLSTHDATSLEHGWTCGEDDNRAGLGRHVQAHMRATVERGLFVVGGSGGVVIGRGAFAIAYGPIMAEHDAQSSGPNAPTSLGRVSVAITDSESVSRPAQLLWASAGWGQLNFAVPEGSATGPARMTIVRQDGSSESTNITIADTAPGFFTGYSCRGAALGTATQRFADGRVATSSLAVCEGPRCSALPIPLSPDSSTEIRLEASGVRHANSVEDIELTVAGRRIPVTSYRAADGGDPGRDWLTAKLPYELHGLGESDLLCRINGQISNVVRLQLGS